MVTLPVQELEALFRHCRRKRAELIRDV